MPRLTRILFVVACAIAVSSALEASPCGGVSRRITPDRKMTLASELARQLQVSHVDVLELFEEDGWSIIHVDTHETDDAFLFYALDPLTSRYVTLWGGAALGDEEREIKDWALENAHGIPPKLARCFAWYVTYDRNNRSS